MHQFFAANLTGMQDHICCILSMCCQTALSDNPAAHHLADSCLHAQMCCRALNELGVPISPSSCNATPAASLSVPQLLSTGPMRSLGSEPWVCLHRTSAGSRAAPGFPWQSKAQQRVLHLLCLVAAQALAQMPWVPQPQGGCTDPAGVSNSSAPSLSGVACALCLQQECTCESGMLQSTNASRLRELLKAAGSGPGQPGMDAAGDMCQASA